MRKDIESEKGNPEDRQIEGPSDGVSAAFVQREPLPVKSQNHLASIAIQPSPCLSYVSRRIRRYRAWTRYPGESPSPSI